MECCCYLRDDQDLLADGKSQHERRFGESFKGPMIPFGALVEYHPISATDQARIHQFRMKVLPGILIGCPSRTCLFAVWFWRRRYSECWDWRIGKVRCIRNISQKTEGERSPDNQRIYISCGRWFSKIIRKRLRIPRTHSEMGIHLKERESQRRISWRWGRVSTWRNKRWRRNQ